MVSWQQCAHVCVTATYRHIFFQHIDLNPMMISYGCFLYRDSKTERKAERERERNGEWTQLSPKCLEKTEEGEKKTIQMTDWHSTQFITMRDGGKYLTTKNHSWKVNMHTLRLHTETNIIGCMNAHTHANARAHARTSK